MRSIIIASIVLGQFIAGITCAQTGWEKTTILQRNSPVQIGLHRDVGDVAYYFTADSSMYWYDQNFTGCEMKAIYGITSSVQDSKGWRYVAQRNFLRRAVANRNVTDAYYWIPEGIRLFILIENDTLIAVQEPGRIQISMTNGDTWKDRTVHPHGKAVFRYYNHNGVIIAALAGGDCVTLQRGDSTWRAVSLGGKQVRDGFVHAGNFYLLAGSATYRLSPDGSTATEETLAPYPFNAFDESGDRIIIGGDSGALWESTDGGTTWKDISHPAISSAVRDIAIRGNGEYVISTYEQNVLCANGAPRKFMYNGLRGGVHPDIEAMHVGRGAALAYLAPMGLYQYDSLAGEWYCMRRHDPGLRNVVCTGTRLVYMASERGFEYSHDGGRTWAFPIGMEVCNKVYAPLPGTVICDADSALISHDSGRTFAPIPVPKGKVEGVVTAGGQNILMVLDPEQGSTFTWLSTDAGYTWERKEEYPGSGWPPAYSTESGMVANTGFSRLAYSSDFGRTWSDNFESDTTEDMYGLFGDSNGHLWGYSRMYGLLRYRSRDDWYVADRWFRYHGDGFKEFVRFIETADGAFGVLTSDSIYIRESVINGIDAPPIVANGFAIDAFPNPANSALHVRVAAEGIPLRLTLFNMLGQPVRTKEAPGSDDVVHTLDVRGLSPGAYMLHVSGGRTIANRVVMIVVR